MLADYLYRERGGGERDNSRFLRICERERGLITFLFVWRSIFSKGKVELMLFNDFNI